MNDKSVVSDLTLAVIAASAEALGSHYQRCFDQCAGFAEERRLARSFHQGFDGDLQDLVGKKVGFDHLGISRIFREALDRRLPPGRGNRRPDRHIWRSDYDRWISSLFPTGRAAQRTQEDNEPERSLTYGRTRVSALVQQSLLRCRRAYQADKASTAERVSPRSPFNVLIPSPYYLAQRVLTDPDAPATEAYARAAIALALLERTREQMPVERFSYDNVSRALEDIYSRADTSKPARLSASSDGVSLFLRHYLAARGTMVFEIERRPGIDATRADRFLREPRSLFNAAKNSPIGLWPHPDYSGGPDAGDLLNELNGLPIPIEGATEIFRGGLRFAASGEVIAAVSGPFGAGKTSACLAIAASLAPFGCRTLFLTCEEDASDIELRLQEASPTHLNRSSSLFRLPKDEDQGNRRPWFRAAKLSIFDKDAGDGDVAAALKDLLDDALTVDDFFDVFWEDDAEKLRALPEFARPVIVIDGFHQLFRETKDGGNAVEISLRRLIDQCRRLRAVVIFTIAANEATMLRLDYLCDLVIQLDRRGFETPDLRTERLFRLLKSRRQPATAGSHPAHLVGPKSFRIKPNINCYAERAKKRRWLDPDPKNALVLLEDHESLKVQARSQTLVIGSGSSGKAGFGLYLLSRRPSSVTAEPSRAVEPDFFQSKPQKGRGAELTSYEARILVVSFLYQAPYYKSLVRRLRLNATNKSKKAEAVAERLNVDVIALYPGDLTGEDFLAKIDNAIKSADLRGIPYNGVLIDGIHNIYIQYPALQEKVTLWPHLYGMLRRRGLNVVTTHTEFELRELHHSRPPSIDFEHASRRAAPLLSALVSAADYVFELTATENAKGGWEYQLHPMTALGDDPRPGYGLWNRQACRVDGFRASITKVAERDMGFQRRGPT